MEVLKTSPGKKDSWFLSFPVDPMPTPRPRAGARNVYNKTEYTEYKKALATMFKSAFLDLWVEATQAFKYDDKGKAAYMKANRYFMICEFFCSSPRGDADNYLKAVQDAMQDAGIIVNDKQIEAPLPWLCPTRQPKNNVGIHIILTRKPSPKTILEKVKALVCDLSRGS